MIWLRQHYDALWQAVGRLRASPVNTVLSMLAIGIALSLPAGGQLLLQNGVQLARSAAPNPQISIYLTMSADDGAVSALSHVLRQHPAVRTAEWVSRETTLARYRQSEGLREVIDVLPRNPFPHAFVVTPADDSPAAMASLSAELRKLPNVEHVQLDSDWVRRLDALLRLGRSFVMVLGLLLGIGLVAITFNITRLQVLTQSQEIELSALLGATASFIRRPFLYFGTLLGVLGGGLAWLLVGAAGLSLAEPVRELSQLYGLSVQLAGFGLAESASLLVLAGALGWLGTALSLRQHLARV